MKAKEANIPLLESETGRRVGIHRRSSSDKASTLENQNSTVPLEILSSCRKKTSGGNGSILKNFHQHQHIVSGTNHTEECGNKDSTALLTHSGNKSLLSSFTRPLLSNTPIGGQGLFHHKRRSSSGVVQMSRNINEDDLGGSGENQGGLEEVSFESGLFNRFRATCKNVKHDLTSKSSTGGQNSIEQSGTTLAEVNHNPQTASGVSLPRTPKAYEVQTVPESVINSDAPCTNSKISLSHIGPEKSHNSDDKDLQSMERSLLSLLHNFQSGKLKAFARNDTMDKMRQIREQQEKLAKLHFDLYEEQEKLSVKNEDAGGSATRNMRLLTGELHELNLSVQKLGWDEGRIREVM